ncbi:apolipoprotein N-acyltransferase [Atopomonas sediminilitoris]|uniref:apolipoprotein N-acyltransferase n=1 Tax=Atopomonas sediminilitoris TaxID=2919919 RepID=UPI001F4E1EC4|nr:apolipoprotein N-acyltransferase [Atopomonas sediminilitoris]MCJ8170667.1 apolipoprotein N-acyltransferase [Atopomonas sediminilitoris]
MRRFVKPGWAGHLLALLVGACTPLALAPFDIWPIALLITGLLYLLLQNLTPHQALQRGWSFGLGAFLTGTGWIYVSIHDYGAASPLLAGGLTLAFCAGVALFFALPAYVWARWLRQSPGLLNPLIFAACWTLGEIFRGWFLTGFPWLYLGYSQLDGPLAGLAPVGGVWLISFAITLSAACFAELFTTRHDTPTRFAMAGLLSLPWLGAVLAGSLSWTTPLGEPVKVSLVQGNINQALKWQPEELTRTLRLYRDLSLDEQADIIVWPETAVPILREYAEDYLSELDQLMNQSQRALITGIPLREAAPHGWRYFNGITVLGNGEGTYLKQKLVPFGEYVPLEDWLRGLISFFDLPMSNFSRGGDAQSLLEAQGLQFASYICYEVVYPDFAARLAADSSVLLTVSNDAWFGDSIGPLQHLQMAQMRALEANRWMLRATNTGVTAFISPDGRISSRLPAFEQGVLRGSVQPVQGLTPYLRWQSWPLLTLCLLLAALAIWQRQRVTKAELASA